MKKFKDIFNQILLEQMTYNQALDVFNLNKDQINPQTIRKQYLTLSKQYHPDKGGDVEKMQNINTAYKILKNKDSSTIKKSSNIKSDEEYTKIILNNIEKRLDVDKFKTYFENLIKKDIKVDIEKSDIKKPHHYGVTYNLTFHTKDKSSVFYIGIHVSYVDLYRMNKSLSGTDDISDFNMYINIDIFHNRRKVKISRRNWSFHQNYNILSDPTVLFPPEKIKKIFTIKSKKFGKKDTYAIFMHELDSKIDYNDGRIVVPLFDDYYMILYRNVYMRTPAISCYGDVYQKKGFSYYKVEDRLPILTMMEIEETVNWLADKIKEMKKTKNINKVINIYKKLSIEYKQKF